MFAVESLVITALVALVIGIGIGLFTGRMSGSPKQQKDLEQRLSDTRSELDSYQQDVARHFMETAQRVTELTQSYRELHEHLANGALKLANPEISRDLLAAGDKSAEPSPESLSHVEAPRDWAPKTPGTQGMLSEEFGLKDFDEPQSEAPTLHKKENTDKSA